MNKTFAAALLGATLLAGTAYAAQQSPSTAPAERAMRGDPLTHADANGDGVVTKSEMVADSDARFAKLDVNKDGKISADERQAVKERRSERGGKRIGRRGGAMGERMLGRIDTDKDGMISLEEQRVQATRRFDRVDANHDGRLDQAERDAARDKMRSMMGRRGGGMTPPADAPDAE
jgi:hypothetical protein